MATARASARPVVALAATTTAGYGVLFYAYGVLLVPMQHDLGWSRTFLSGAFSAALVVSALLTIPVGRWLDRHPPRPLFLLGSISATGLVVGWAIADQRAVFVVVWVLLGSCQAALFYGPAFTVLTKWFDGLERHRAITSVTLVAGLASTIFGPLTAALENAFGWRTAVVVLAAVLGAVTVPAFVFLLHRPEAGGEQARAADVLPRDALRSRDFWLLTGAYLLAAITTFAVAVHLVAYLRGRGLAAGTAAAALGAVGLVQVLGRGTFVRLSARRHVLHLGTWVLAAKGAGLVLLLVVPGLPGVAAFVIVYGAANGMATLTQAVTIGELYGARHYGAISAVIASVSAVGGALAPFAAAAAIDLVGDEDPVFFALAVVSGLAAAANVLVARRRVVDDVARSGAAPPDLVSRIDKLASPER